MHARKQYIVIISILLNFALIINMVLIIIGAES